MLLFRTLLQRHLSTFFLGMMSFLALFSTSLRCEGAERVLNFPDSAPVGFVSCSPMPTYDGPFIVFSNSAVSVQRAHGRVVVPDDCFVELELIGSAFQDLNFLSKLPTNAIHSLKIAEAKLNGAQILSIAHLTSLLRLSFETCEFSPEAFSELPEFPKLVALHCSRSRNPGSLGLDTWIKKSAKLESIHVMPPLGAKELASLGGHPSLTFINVKVESDFPQSMTALKELPSLKGVQLDLHKTVNANNDLLEGIGQITQLEWIRWFGGKVDTPTLAELSELPHLKRLDLLLFEAGPGFCKAIESLKELERLEISTNDNAFKTERANLTRSLFQLPKLKWWPKVESVDFETLCEICKLDHIEKLSFKDMSSVSSNQMKELGRLKNLVQLELEHVDVDDDWLSCLSRMKNLEYLSLFATRVDGSGFQALADLTALKRMWIFNESQRLKLESVAALPGLESLRLGGQFLPPMVEPLRKSESLNKLFLEGSEKSIDDTTVAWIGECPGLVELALEGNVTEAAVDSIAKLPSIHRLQIWDSSITKDGINKLASLPTIRILSVETTSEVAPEMSQEIKKRYPWLPYVMIRNQAARN